MSPKKRSSQKTKVESDAEPPIVESEKSDVKPPPYVTPPRHNKESKEGDLTGSKVPNLGDPVRFPGENNRSRPTSPHSSNGGPPKHTAHKDLTILGKLADMVSNMVSFGKRWQRDSYEPSTSTCPPRSDESSVDTPGSLHGPHMTADGGIAKLNFASLFNNNKYADVTIHFVNKKKKIHFPAHQVILGTRSPYFEDALQNKNENWLPTEMDNEAVIGLLGLHAENATSHSITKNRKEFKFGDRPHALWRALEYIYTGTYSDKSTLPGDDGDDLPLTRHLRVYNFAVLFRMEDLKSFAYEKFRQDLRQYWTSDKFPDCIADIYRDHKAPSPMRKAVVETVSLHRQLLHQPRFQSLFRSGRVEDFDFQLDLVLKLAE